MDAVRLMLVDDHDLVRTSLKTFLNSQEGMVVISEAKNGQEALRLAQETRPDVVLMDITMPGIDGLEATRLMHSTCPECRVLALTVHNDKQYFFEMLSAGATGYMTKQAAAEDLLDAIRAVAQGHVYLQPALASWLLEDYRRLRLQSPSPSLAGEMEHASGAKGLDVLSDREVQVLELVAEGLTNSEIGAALGISPKTVARHRERIMNKLDIHSSTELVKFAIRTGVINLS